MCPNNPRTNLRRSVVAAIASLTAAGSNAVLAQDSMSEDDGLEEIVVTGTRISRPIDDTVAIDMIDSERIEIRGYRNIIEGINELPINGVSVTNEGANTQFGDNSAFPNLLNLGTQRTLTLVNGRRFVSSNQATVFVPGNANGVQVDTTVYNPALLERTEVLTVGGGPIYGADAVAGVVNLVLKDNYEGLNVVGQGGISELGDGEETRLSVLWGKNFMNDRANITLGGEYLNTALVRARPGRNNRRAIDTSGEEFVTPPSFTNTQSSLLFTGARDPRFVQGGVLINTARGSGGAGSPLLTESDRLRGDFFSLNPLALIGSSSAGVGNSLVVNNPDPLTNGDFPTLAVPLRFLPNGSLAPFAFGDVQNFPAERSAVIGGNDGLLEGSGNNVRSGQERTSFNFLGRFDITDNLTIKQDFVYSEITNQSAEEPLGNSAYGSNSAGSRGIPVFIDQNPLFAQNVGIIDNLVTQGLAVDDIGGQRVLYLSREMSDVHGDIISGNEATTFRSVTSLEGDFEFADRSFNWDVAYIYGKSESDNFDVKLAGHRICSRHRRG